MSQATAQGLYLHVPFCLRKCLYCDFSVRVLHHPQQIERYLEALLQELEALAHLPHTLQTVYIGGGTPSLLNPEALAHLLRGLKKNFDLTDVQEWTFEVNPEQQSARYFKQCRAAGINRISLGAQSFIPAELEACGRHHRAEDIKTCVERLRESGFEQISLDLIYGLPHQTAESWRESLHRALELHPQHLSLYSLEIQPKTLFSYMENRAKLDRPCEDEEVNLYQIACELLQKSGFEHYEIANWSRPGCASRHNSLYWRAQPVLAAGVGAHGYWQGKRYANPDSLTDYYQQCREQNWAWQHTPPQSPQEAAAERLILGLRLLEEGVNSDLFAHDFGLKPEQACPEMQTMAHAGWLWQREGNWYLNPEYVLLSNEIFAQLLEPQLPG